MEHDGVPLYPQTYPSQIKENNMHSMSPPMPMPVQNQPMPHQPVMLLGPENTVTTCTFCHASIKTAVTYTNNTRTHIAAALWCTICCMCCIPYGSDSAKNADHYCPNCKRYLGTYHR